MYFDFCKSVLRHASPGIKISVTLLLVYAHQDELEEDELEEE